MLRVLENVQLKDGIHTKTLLENQKILSVNQLAGNIKLTELWKATHVEKYPPKVFFFNVGSPKEDIFSDHLL